MDKRGLLIKKGGLVEFSRWSTEKREYETRDVTGETICFLMEHVFFEEGLTLRDVFAVLEKEKDIYQVLIGNWLDEYLEEAAKPTEKPSDLESLIVSWRVTCDNKDKRDFMREAPEMLMPDFSGWGKNEEGEYVTWGVDFSPVNDLMDLPIKLEHNLKLYINGSTEEFAEANFGLFQVLYGIIWELSFYGSPSSRSETLDGLNKTMEEIKAGTAELYPMDDLFSDDSDES